VLRFKSEESKGGEIGFRSRILDRSLIFNVTGFHYVFKDQQVQLFDPAIFAFDTTNAGELTTSGIDIDFLWMTEIEGLSFSGSWGLLSTEITGDLITASGANLKGRDAGFSPDLSGNIAINWEANLNESFRLRMSSNLAYKGDFIVGGGTLNEFDSETNPQGYLVQDSYTTIDIRVSLLTNDEKWRLSLIGTNLNDEQYLTFAGPAPFRPATGDDQLVGITRGRQIFVELGFNF